MRWDLVLLLAVVLACPISMMWMMRGRRYGQGGDMPGMGGTRDRPSDNVGAQEAVGRGASPLAERESVATRDLRVESGQPNDIRHADPDNGRRIDREASHRQ